MNNLIIIGCILTYTSGISQILVSKGFCKYGTGSSWTYNFYCSNFIGPGLLHDQCGDFSLHLYSQSMDPDVRLHPQLRLNVQQDLASAFNLYKCPA